MTVEEVFLICENVDSETLTIIVDNEGYELALASFCELPVEMLEKCVEKFALCQAELIVWIKE